MATPEFRLPETLPGEQWKPSNGTVGYAFVADVCGDCERDRDGDCAILARSFLGEAVEWRETEQDGCFCLAYVPLGESIPEPPCPHTMPLDFDRSTPATSQVNSHPASTEARPTLRSRHEP